MMTWLRNAPLLLTDTLSGIVDKQEQEDRKSSLFAVNKQGGMATTLTLGTFFTSLLSIW